jgi:hypothetical protein
MIRARELSHGGMDLSPRKMALDWRFDESEYICTDKPTQFAKSTSTTATGFAKPVAPAE